MSRDDQGEGERVFWHRLWTVATALVLVLGASPGLAAATADRTEVLIQFASAPTHRDLELVRAAGGDVRRTFSIVPAVAASIPNTAIAALQENPRVAVVEPDSLLYALEYRETHDWGISHVNADDVHRQATANTGAGIRVAVIDSGIDCDHLELPASRCDYGQTHGWNFVNETSQADDDWGHGTHVAGTIAAALNGTTGGVVGVAPGATVISMKTLDDSGSGAWSRHIAAIERVWNSGIPIAEIVNMSIGRGDYSATAEAAMQKAYDAGVLLVAAAGNGGNCGGKGDNVSYPAAFESVIAVAAVDSGNERPCWSSTGPDVELTGPGVSVFSTWPASLSTSYRDPQPVCDDGDGDGTADDCHYKYGSGTSMSSPHVAGVAALVLASKSVTDANANGLADEVRQRLVATAADLGRGGRDPQYGHGLIDAAAAVGLTVSDPGDGGDGGASGPLTLTATGTKVKGEKQVELIWSDTSDPRPAEVDIYRDGAVVATVPNSGSFTELLGKGGGSYTYKVCHTGSDPSICSNEAAVEF